MDNLLETLEDLIDRLGPHCPDRQPFEFYQELASHEGIDARFARAVLVSPLAHIPSLTRSTNDEDTLRRR